MNVHLTTAYLDSARDKLYTQNHMECVSQRLIRIFNHFFLLIFIQFLAGSVSPLFRLMFCIHNHIVLFFSFFLSISYIYTYISTML